MMSNLKLTNSKMSGWECSLDWAILMVGLMKWSPVCWLLTHFWPVSSQIFWWQNCVTLYVCEIDSILQFYTSNECIGLYFNICRLIVLAARCHNSNVFQLVRVRKNSTAKETLFPRFCCALQAILKMLRRIITRVLRFNSGSAFHSWWNSWNQ